MSTETEVSQESGQRWWIHLTHPGGETSVSFHGTEIEAAKKAATYIGKVASWNATKEPHEPNTWDTYERARIEEIAPSVGNDVDSGVAPRHSGNP